MWFKATFLLQFVIFRI